MEEPSTPHVVILPFPAQGHIKPMFHLAQLLCQATNFKVTFVNSDHNHHRLLNSIDLPALHDRLPRLNLVSLSDGLPFDHPRNGRLAVEWLSGIWSVTKPLFRDLMISVSKKEESGRPTCVIADGVMSFALDVAEEVGVPVISFRTDSASSTWVYFNVEKLIQEGQIPFPENEDMDRPITSIPGFESFLRRRDLPSICRFQEIQNPVFEFFVSQTIAMTRASALILNTFEELESPTISRLCSLFPKIYTIGPLHALSKNSKPPPPPPSSSDSSNGSLWKQDMSCMTWLDSQPSKSVLYISFGSLFRLTRDQLLEFWYGVVNSGKPFLWVLRPDLVKAEDNGGSVVVGQIPTELEEGTEERGCIVDWAPQEEILAHWAIGGFLTHSGWNSVLESIYAGVSMIGWPQIADQQVNSRCVSDLWKIGVDMKDTCDRFTVEKMVRELMPDDDRRDDTIMKSTVEIAKMARDCVEQGGSSCRSLEKLIEDIRSMRPCPRDD